MEEIIDFFIVPYRESPVHMITIEFIAAVMGIASVFYAKRESVLVYPTGIISTAMYVYLLSQWQMYGDLIINIYYTIMSIYGWYMWTRVVDNSTLEITKMTKKDYWSGLLIFVFTSLFVLFVYSHYKIIDLNMGLGGSINHVFNHFDTIENIRKVTPYIDTFTTGIFFVAMLLMAKKKIEHWVFWIVGNIISVPLYFIKGFGFTGIQYTIFLGLAYLGYKEWKRSLDK